MKKYLILLLTPQAALEESADISLEEELKSVIVIESEEGPYSLNLAIALDKLALRYMEIGSHDESIALLRRQCRNRWRNSR